MIRSLPPLTPPKWADCLRVRTKYLRFVLLLFAVRASVLLCNTLHTYMPCDFPHSTHFFWKSDILRSRVHKMRRANARSTQTYLVDGIKSREGVIADVPDPVWFPALGFVRIRRQRLPEQGSRRVKELCWQSFCSEAQPQRFLTYDCCHCVFSSCVRGDHCGTSLPFSLCHSHWGGCRRSRWGHRSGCVAPCPTVP